MRRRAPTFHDLGAAIAWLREHWSERETPLRLHSRAIDDGGAPQFAPAFARYLDETSEDRTTISRRTTCAHTRLVSPDLYSCPDCTGTGVMDSTTVAYRYPMWRAMERLGAYDRRHPSKLGMVEVILTLVINAFDAISACRVLSVPISAILLAIRRLHERYELAPIELRVEAAA